MAHTPLINHWWNVALYVSARGLTTSLIPTAAEASRSTSTSSTTARSSPPPTGERRSSPSSPVGRRLPPRGHGALDELGLSTPSGRCRWRSPARSRSTATTLHAAYDADAAHRFWRALVQIDRVFEMFRARFVGKVSPVHFFWGARTWRSPGSPGGPRPPIPAGRPTAARTSCGRRTPTRSAAPATGPAVDGEGVYYSYAYPEPDGLPRRCRRRQGRHRPRPGRVHAALHRGAQATDPDAVLLEFLQSTYDIAADTAGWDRQALERR